MAESVLYPEELWANVYPGGLLGPGYSHILVVFDSEDAAKYKTNGDINAALRGEGE